MIVLLVLSTTTYITGRAKVKTSERCEPNRGTLRQSRLNDFGIRRLAVDISWTMLHTGIVMYRTYVRSALWGGMVLPVVPVVAYVP